MPRHFCGDGKPQIPRPSDSPFVVEGYSGKIDECESNTKTPVKEKITLQYL